MLQQTRNVIEDGYTRRGYIKPDERLHEGLAIEYRPMLPEQVEDLEHAVRKAKPAEQIRLLAAAMAGQLVAWSEVDKAGTSRRIDAESVRRLNYKLLSELASLVKGLWPGDPLPDATDQEESEYVKGLKAQAEGKAPGHEQLAADQKN